MKLIFICLSVAFATHHINDEPSGWICAKPGCSERNAAGTETCTACGGGWSHNAYSTESDLTGLADSQNAHYADRCWKMQRDINEEKAIKEYYEKQKRQTQRLRQEAKQRAEAQRQAQREAVQIAQAKAQAKQQEREQARNRQERRKFEAAQMQTQHLRKVARKSDKRKVKFSHKPDTVHEYPRCPTEQHERNGYCKMDSQSKWLRTWQGKDPKEVCQYMSESQENMKDALPLFTKPKIRQTIKNARETALLSFMNRFGITQLSSESLWEKVKALDNCLPDVKECKLDWLAKDMVEAAVNKGRHITKSEANKVLEDALELWRKVKQPGA